jgi:hypothetical protein
MDWLSTKDADRCCVREVWGGRSRTDAVLVLHADWTASMGNRSNATDKSTKGYSQQDYCIVGHSCVVSPRTHPCMHAAASINQICCYVRVECMHRPKQEQ